MLVLVGIAVMWWVWGLIVIVPALCVASVAMGVSDRPWVGPVVFVGSGLVFLRWTVRYMRQLAVLAGILEE